VLPLVSHCCLGVLALGFLLFNHVAGFVTTCMPILLASLSTTCWVALSLSTACKVLCFVLLVLQVLSNYLLVELLESWVNVL
jgi:hypothetical protein